MVLVLRREVACPHPLERPPDRLDLVGLDEDLEERTPVDLLERVARQALAGAVEAHQPALAVEHDDERGRVESISVEVKSRSRRSASSARFRSVMSAVTAM